MTACAEHDDAARAASAIRHHYDVGNAFYRLWLDESLTYSCALPDHADDTLESAQERKLQFHLRAVRAERARSVLDIGCGWGAILRRLAEEYHVPHAVGLTLSDEQAAHIRSCAYPGVDVRTESWTDYEPRACFDGIISIGAFEHFARPGDTAGDRARRYREFFTRCRGWLADDGALSLQTIAYANMARADASTFIQQEIFPDADLPTLAEITAAAETTFELESLTNGRHDYAWTCEKWARRLRDRRDEAVHLVGAETVERYLRYLKLSALGFRMGKICLLRMVFRPLASGYFDARRRGA